MEQKTSDYKAQKSQLVEVGLAVQSALNKVFNFFSLKKSKQFWGIVYDSSSKQPLDPVLVKLLYVNGTEVETCVTDMSGHYGFLARPGKFKLLVRKTNYSFPSRKVTGDQDGIYENIYHGEFFTLYDESEVVAPNIPMDPDKFDWNQQAKKGMVNTKPFAKLLFKRLIAVIFWFGLLFSGIEFWGSGYKLTSPAGYFLAGYLALIFLAYFVSQTRLWGSVKTNIFLDQGEYLLLELQRPELGSMVFGHCKVNEQNRFLLRASPGKYSLQISKLNPDKEKIFLGSLPVHAGSDGVINSTLIIKSVAGVV